MPSMWPDNRPCLHDKNITFAGRKNTLAIIETMSKYHVTRIVSVLQSIAVKATSETEAIEKARKSLFKEWATVDNKRRKNYKAVKVEYPC